MTPVVIDADWLFWHVTRDYVDGAWAYLAEATGQYEVIDERTPLVSVIVETRLLLATHPYRGDRRDEIRDECLERLQRACPHPLLLEGSGEHEGVYVCYCCKLPDPPVETAGDEGR
jgi:hypothetical protein